MSLEDIKTLLEITDSSKDAQITLIQTNVTKQLIGRLRRSLPDILLIPAELDWIVTEVSVIRFNRIGSEGMVNESVEGHSATYNSNDFAQFLDDIQDYIDIILEPDPLERRGKVRFI